LEPDRRKCEDWRVRLEGQDSIEVLKRLRGTHPDTQAGPPERKTVPTAAAASRFRLTSR
jgi:hypothetical protein